MYNSLGPEKNAFRYMEFDWADDFWLLHVVAVSN